MSPPTPPHLQTDSAPPPHCSLFFLPWHLASYGVLTTPLTSLLCWTASSKAGLLLARALQSGVSPPPVTPPVSLALLLW